MPSSTLIPEDKTIIRSAIGHDCQIYTATIARLYQSTNGKDWQHIHTGAIAFMKDTKRMNAFFFRMVDLTQQRVIWEQELYRDFSQPTNQACYRQDRPWLHSFGGDDALFALSFADENEAVSFYSKVMNRDNLRIAARPSQSQASAPSVKKAAVSGGKKKFDKSAIGAPSNFRHLTHVGYSADTGFNMVNVPPEWTRVFEKAGVTEEQLKDQNTAKFIFDFMSQNIPAEEPAQAAQPVVQERIESKRQPPAPPSRGNQQAPEPPKARQPPPPPSRTSPPQSRVPPPQPQREQPLPPQRQPPPQQERPVPDPPSKGGIPLPPTAPVAPPVVVSSNQPLVKQPKKDSAPPAEGRDDLLAAIRSSGKTKLKPAAERQVDEAAPAEAAGGIAGALKMALMSRQNAMTGDDGDSEKEDGDDEDW